MIPYRSHGDAVGRVAKKVKVVGGEAFSNP